MFCHDDTHTGSQGGHSTNQCCAGGDIDMQVIKLLDRFTIFPGDL